MSEVAITKYISAIDGLSLSQAQAVLSTSALNDEQKEQVLISAGLVQSKNAMTLAEVKELATSMSLSTQKKEEILTTLQGAYSEGEWNEERLETIVLAGGEEGAIAKVILAKKAENAENVKSIASGKSLLAVLKQQIAALASNPLTWVGIGVAGVALSLYKTSEAIGEVEDKAQDLSDTFNKGKTDINNYKSRIEDLYDVISDSGSSIAEVTTARETLMTVQDELIDKFGDEKETIDLITQAINGQSDALDVLTQKQWQATKNEFNQSDIWNSFANWKEGYATNIERMAHEMENAWGNIKLSPSDYFSGEYKDIINKLEEAGWKYSSSSETFVKGGSVEDLYEEILEIQTLAGQDMPDNFLNSLTKDANELKATIDSYEGMWDAYILNDKIFGDDKLAKSWNEVNTAYKTYQKAVSSGEKESVESAMVGFATSINKVLDDENVSDSVKDYFEDMYPSLYREVEKWEFKVNILPKESKDRLSNFTREDILEAIQSDEYSYIEAKFNSILSLAEDYGIVTGTNTEKIQQLLSLLEEWGVIQKTITETAPKVDDINFAITPEEAEALSDYQSKIDSITSTYDKIFNLTSDDITSLMTDFREYAYIFEEFGVTGKEGVGDIQGALHALAEKLKEVALEKCPQMADAIESIFGKVANYDFDFSKNLDSFNELDELLTKVRNGTVFHQDELSELLVKYPKLASAIQKVAEGYKLEEEAVTSLTNTSIEALNISIASKMEQLKLEIEGIVKKGVKDITPGIATSDTAILDIFSIAAAIDGKELESLKEKYNGLEELQQKLLDLQAEFNKNNATTELFDWYEIAMERLQRNIDNLGDTVGNVYEPWSERQSALNDQIDETNKLLDIQRKAYQAYQDKAEAVGLDSKYENLIKQGYRYGDASKAFSDLDSKDDEKLIKKIQEFTKWWELYLNTVDAANESQRNLNEYRTQGFTDIQTQYDAVLADFENQASLIEAGLANAEARGQLAVQGFYQQLYANEEMNRAALVAERIALEEALQKTGLTGGEEFDKLQDEIDGVTIAIAESENALLEFENAIRDADWGIFDFNREQAQRVMGESDFLLDLLDAKKLVDEMGEFTDNGLASIGLHGVNYNGYLEESIRYTKELAELEEDLAKAENANNTDLINRRNELLEQSQEMILAAEQEKSAIADLVRESYENMKSSLQDLITEYEKALDAEKD